MASFAFDIETLGSNSDSVILSAALIHFDLDDIRVLTTAEAEAKYQQLLDSALFIKFNVQQQRQLGRKIDKKTLEWWTMKVDDRVRAKSFKQDGTEMDLKPAIEKIREFGYSKQTNMFQPHPVVWSRGGFDGFIFDNMCKMVGVEPCFGYWTYQDFRTAINMRCETARHGYAQIPNFDSKAVCIKHDPVHDCALDIMMLLYGE